MSLSYDGSLLDHLAEHMIFLSTASLFWYSLNLSYDHGFYISHCLGMTPHDYECLLAAANLAHYHPNGASPYWLIGENCSSRGSAAWPSWLLHCLSPSSCCATLLSSLHIMLLHCLSSSSCCALLASSHCAGLLLHPHSTSRYLVVSLSCPATLSSSRRTSWLLNHLSLSSLVGIDLGGSHDFG